MVPKGEEEIFLENAQKEITRWRKYFLDGLFRDTFKFIPEHDKERLRDYYLAIPSDRFRGPWEEWNACVSCLLQSKNENGNL